MKQSCRAILAERFFARFGLLIVAFIIAAIVLEISSFFVLLGYRRFHGDSLVPHRIPAYDSEAWGNEFWTEQMSFWNKARSNYLPFMVWGVRKWHGRYINTDQNEMGTWRRTIQAMNEGCTKKPVRKIWVFGGSTVYGIGTPDWATIPSYLSRDLNATASACVEVTNLGADGYVTNQEAILLIQQLKTGRRPDIVIFYDGVNESLVGAFRPGIPTAHANFDLIKARIENTAVGKLGFLSASHGFQLISLIMEHYVSKENARISDRELDVRARATLQNYEANLEFLRILASAYGFKAYFFWQPLLTYGDKPLTPFEEKLKQSSIKELGGEVHRSVTGVYQRAESCSAKSKNFIFLGHIFNTSKEPLYVDEFHLDARGNEIIASIMAQTLQGIGRIE